MSPSQACKQTMEHLTSEQRRVLAFLDGMLMEKARRESAAVQAESWSFTQVRARMRAAFPFLQKLPEGADVPFGEEQAERWAIVALMGHRQVAGRVSEELFAGAPMRRVDIPQPDGSFSTRLYGGSALYEVTYVTEEVARAVADRDPAHPISVWTARGLGLLPPSAAGALTDGVDDPDEGPF